MGRGARAPRPRPPSRKLTAVVQRGDLEDTVTATGTLQPRDYVDVGTQVSGQLKKLHVEIGGGVKEGELLAEIDPTVYRARSMRRSAAAHQEAQLADRQAQLELAEQQAQRQENLMRENATTADAVQTAEAALESAKAQIDALKAQIEQTRSTLRGDEANLELHQDLRADGRHRGLAEREAGPDAERQPVGADRRAHRRSVDDDGADAGLRSRRVASCASGMDVYFTTLGDQTQALVRQAAPDRADAEVVNNVVLYNALFDVTNPDRALMTQMTAQVFFVVGAGEGRRARAGERAAAGRGAWPASAPREAASEAMPRTRKAARRKAAGASARRHDPRARSRTAARWCAWSKPTARSRAAKCASA